MIGTTFEYQIKDVLVIQNDSILAVHPMIYQVFQIQLDTKSFVYPIPSEEEEKLLFSIFE